MEAKLYGQNKGGTSINGIIKDYYAYARENISAGDLVEYVNGVAGKTEKTSEDIQLIAEANSGKVISAVALDNNRVFIAHSYGSSNYLYGVVCTIDGTSIACGTDTAIESSLNAGSCIEAVRLSNGDVFIAHSYGSSYYLYGIVVSISGTTITKGTDTSLVGASQAGSTISACLLPSGKVFIAHVYNSSKLYLYGIVCTVSDKKITVGTDKAIVEGTRAGLIISTCVLPSGNVFIAHSSSNSSYLYAIVVSISGSTITNGTDTSLSTTTGAGHRISACLLANGDVFIAHTYNTSYYLYGVVCSVSGTTITKGADTKLYEINNVTNKISTCLLSNGNIFILHSNSNNKLRGIICTVSDKTIVSGENSDLIEGNYVAYIQSALLLPNDTILVAHSYESNYYLYAQIFGIDEANNIPTNSIVSTEYETQVRKVTTGQFDGIAKTSGTGGDDTGHKDIVSIWTKVPIVTQEFAMADGNTLADANGDIFLVREAS